MPETDLDEELTEGLKRAKKTACNFALIGKGAKPVKLIVRKKPIPDGEVNKAKAEFKGNDVSVGTVLSDGMEYVFSVLEIPGIKPAALKEFINDQTKLAVKSRFELVPSLEKVDEAEGSPPSSTVPTPPPAPLPPENPLRAQLTETLKKLVVQSGAVITSVPSIRDEVIRLAGAAKLHLQDQQLDLDKAKKHVFELGSLLKSVVSPPTDAPPPLPPRSQTAPPPPPPPPPTPPPTDAPPPLPPRSQTAPPPPPTPPPTDAPPPLPPGFQTGPTPPPTDAPPPLPPGFQTGPTPPPNPVGPPPPQPVVSPPVTPSSGGTTPTSGPTTAPVTGGTLPGLKKPPLPPKLPGVYFRKSGAPLFSLSTGDKTPDQLEAEKFVAEHAAEIFGTPKDPGSAELDLWNDILTTKGVNDAETTNSGPSAKELNCSFCTIGALTGKTSSEMSMERQKKAGVTNPDPKLQEMTIWGNPTGDPSKMDQASSDFTAQISPMKDMAKDFVADSGGKYDFVDNLNLVDNGSGILVPETFDEKKLIADMKKLPNGTRYSVYMKGALPQESHWCYAEKRNDFIIFRDYQQSIQIPKGRTNEAFVTGPGITVDQLPLGPAKGNKIFIEGTFFAIKPK